jgi:8-amino-7-oxononanoate synthase
VRTELAALENCGLRRTLAAPAGIDLSSNDYLGLARHPLLKKAMAEAVEREGCGSTGSRLLRGERPGWTALERRFAGFQRAPRAVYFSSGYLANIAVMSAIPQAGDVIFSDERNHASLIDGIRLSRASRHIFPHADVAALASALRDKTAPGQKFVVTESLFSMDGDIAPLADYAALCRACGAALIVDEAHAVGVYGSHGSGLLEQTGVESFLTIATAGKALGVSGAFVSGPDWAVDYLVQRARPFLFSTAAPPPIAAAIEASLDLVESEPWRRQQLLERARYLRRLVGVSGESQIIPIPVGENGRAVQVADALRREGFDARAIRPPTVAPGTARLRLAVNLDLPEATLDRFAAALERVLKQSLCSAASS